ncbi:sulfotransferase [Nitzschia inconspicua]|uniref:Sulfotransferase n=1 Tax=Nitzschia inconspicua TaxID=303405 RepID=A0A9K3KB55_9STRA|nr:sulfotransferase [Nitzschia inconspicua]KAG7362423.1 sulfotransferase [Nitzschia inconspicua]
MKELPTLQELPSSLPSPSLFPSRRQSRKSVNVENINKHRKSNNSSNSSTNMTHNALEKLGLFVIFLCLCSISVNHLILLEESESVHHVLHVSNSSNRNKRQELTVPANDLQQRNHFRDVPSQQPLSTSTLSSTTTLMGTHRSFGNNIYTCTYGNTTVTVPTHTPTFIMIGVQKSGTTALLTYFREHPQILETKKKFTREAHFFDTSWNSLIKKAKAMGLTQATEKNCYILETYMYLFQTEQVLEQRRRRQGNDDLPSLFTFEKTPSYFANPMIAQRIQQIVPWSKVILILRNPTDRLYSQYKMTIKDVFDLRKYSLEDMVHHELYAMKYQYNMTTAPLLLGEEETLAEYRDDNNTLQSIPTFTPQNVPFNHPIPPHQWTPPHKSLGKYTDHGPLGHHILLRRGLYSIQLQWWLKHFTIDDNMLVIDYSDLTSNTQEVYERILRFCNIPVVTQNQELQKVRADERKDHRPLSNTTRHYLQQFYAPYNAQLEALLGHHWNAQKLGW